MHLDIPDDLGVAEEQVALDLVLEFWPAIEKVAEIVAERGTLPGYEAHQLISDSLRNSGCHMFSYNATNPNPRAAYTRSIAVAKSASIQGRITRVSTRISGKLRPDAAIMNVRTTGAGTPC